MCPPLTSYKLCLDLWAFDVLSPGVYLVHNMDLVNSVRFQIRALIALWLDSVRCGQRECVCVCVCVCARARACVCVCVHACVRYSAHVRDCDTHCFLLVLLHRNHSFTRNNVHLNREPKPSKDSKKPRYVGKTLSFTCFFSLWSLVSLYIFWGFWWMIRESG